MTIPKITPYSGGVANPDGSQTQTEFTQNMFDQLSYEAELSTELNSTVDGINETATQVDADATSAAQSAASADASASGLNYQGLWPDTGGSANKGDTYQTQVSGTPTGQYFTALQNTTANPVGDNVNWREGISKSYVDFENQIQNSNIESNTVSISLLDSRVSTNESDISALQAGQGSGVYGYSTRADLEADLTPPDGAVGLVTNDPTTTNNTNYIKVGGSGSGSWTQGDDTLAAQAYQQSLESETYLEKNERVYDLKNRVRFVDGEINEPQYAPDLSPRPALDYSVISNNLVVTGTGASSLPSVWWLGHVRKLDRNTEVIMRITLDADYTGGSSAGPGPMIYFGDTALRGYLYSESGYIFGFDGNRSGQGTYGQTPQDTLAQFTQGEEVELRVVLRKDGTGFAIGKKISNGYELRLDLDESNLSTFQDGKIWVGYNRDIAQTVTHFEVNELEVIPEDFNQSEVLSDISSLQQRVELLEDSVGEKLIPYSMPDGFSMYQDLGFKILRGMRTKAFYTTFDPLDHLITTANSYWVNKDGGSDSNDGSELNPFATFAKAVTEANAAGASTINVLGNEYSYQDTGLIPQITVDVNIIGNSPTERPEITTASTEGGWVLDPTFTNLWSVTVSGDAPINCYDRSIIDEVGGYSGLIERTQSDANDTLGSFYVSGNTVWVRTHDDREPDSDFRVVRDLPMLDFSNQLFYLQDMEFRGGNTYTAVAPDNAAGTCVTNNCSFSHGVDQGFRWIRSSGTSRIIHYKSETAWSSQNDGFSYTSAGSGTEAIEIECYGHHNGIEKGSTHNGSTIHTATRMIRVNCIHEYNWNKNVADVSTNTQSLNLGVIAGSAKDTSSPASSVNFNCQNSEMWLDSCVSNGGSLTDFDVDVGSTMRVRNTDLNLKSIVENGTLEQF